MAAMNKIKNSAAILMILTLMVMTILTAAVLLHGLEEIGEQEQGQAAVKEEFFNYTLHFCSREDCAQAIISQLHSAKLSVKCAFYRADNSVIESIPDSVAAEIVVDEKARAAAVNSSFIRIYKSNSKGIMHNKYCIIDNSTVVTGSFNPTAAARNDYNDLLTVNSTGLAAFYSSNFEKLKLGSIGSSKKTPTSAAVANSKLTRKAAILNSTAAEVYFCPEDNCAATVRKELRAANKSIIFAAYSFTHPDIANELILKGSEGIAVAGIIEKSTAGSKYSKHSAMAANGIELRLEASKKLLHYKFFVIDGETVITGSFNPTKSADERNNENIIIIRNKALAGKYLEEFNKIFGGGNVHE